MIAMAREDIFTLKLDFYQTKQDLIEDLITKTFNSSPDQQEEEKKMEIEEDVNK